MASNVSVHILGQSQYGEKISTAYLPREHCTSLERAKKWIEHHHTIDSSLQYWYACSDEAQLNLKQVENGELSHDQYYLYVDVSKNKQDGRLVAEFNNWIRDEPNNTDVGGDLTEQEWLEDPGQEDSFLVLKNSIEVQATDGDVYDEVEVVGQITPLVLNTTRVTDRVRKTVSDTCHLCSDDQDLYYCYTCEDESTTSCVFCKSCINTIHADSPVQHTYDHYHDNKAEGDSSRDSGVADNSYKTNEQASGGQIPYNHQAPPAAQQPALPTPPAAPAGKWRCTECTFENDDWRPGCELCSTNKPETTPAGNQQQEEYDYAAVDEHYIEYTDPDPGWSCDRCTFRNLPRYMFCTTCLDGQRPEDYQEPANYKPTPEEIDYEQKKELAELLTHEALAVERDRDRNFQEHLATNDQDIFFNSEQFDCAICFDTVEPGDGVIVRECHHEFCRECLKGHIEASEQADIGCPGDGCEMKLLEREIKQIAPEALERIHARGLQQAEAQCPNAFHCKSSDCTGWCETTDEANFFECEVCKKKNCLTCKAQHEGQNCKEYQDALRFTAQNDADAQATQQAIDQMLEDGEAMKCPQCSVILMKKAGCDWMQCSVCQLEICWVTKQARWGPKGTGDTSGGCKCNWVNDNPCAPNCGFCH